MRHPRTIFPHSASCSAHDILDIQAVGATTKLLRSPAFDGTSAELTRDVDIFQEAKDAFSDAMDAISRCAALKDLTLAGRGHSSLTYLDTHTWSLAMANVKGLTGTVAYAGIQSGQPGLPRSPDPGCVATAL